MRLNKFISRAGVCSRRQADEMIDEGRVAINGVAVSELGSKVDVEKDLVTVDGQIVEMPREKSVYLAINKPRGVVSTLSDPFAVRTLADIAPERFGRLFPVGRLDKDSQGLVLMTNDGDLAQRLTHPSFEVEKEYIVSTDRKLSASEIRALRAGELTMEDGSPAAPVKVVDAPVSRQGNHRYYFILREGKNREIRVLLSALNINVKRLKRLRIGPVHLGVVPLGEWRFLSREEENALGVLKQAEEPETKGRPSKKGGKRTAAKRSGAPQKKRGAFERGRQAKKSGERTDGRTKRANSDAKKGTAHPGKRGSVRGGTPSGRVAAKQGKRNANAPKIARAKNIKGSRRSR